MSFNILLAHIPGKANTAADFLSRMQTDPCLSLQIKLSDRVPVRETGTEIEKAAKSSYVSLSRIESVQNIPDNTTEPVDAEFLEQHRKHGLDDHF